MDLLLYSPIQPILDIGAVICLALMAVGTIVSASLWDEFTSQPIDDNYDQLERKVFSLPYKLFQNYLYFCLVFFPDNERILIFK